MEIQLVLSTSGIYKEITVSLLQQIVEPKLSPNKPVSEHREIYDIGLLTTFELHMNKGAITNIISIHRPLSLYGLTANMKGYEPNDLKTFQK